ncbi:MAG: polyamine aminopropyltransferase [Chloroflexota bacterium]|nr:polyamine aminopropyltransferase [Chloroflexota bacterium]
MDQQDWFAEQPYAGIEQRYRVRARLHSQTTRWQSLEVVDLEGPGRSLILGGTLQTSVGEEFMYHEPLVHVPMFAHPNPHRVLIIGGGDGGALRHALMHTSVGRALEVEIDEAVVQASLRFLPEISDGAYLDARAELRIADGAEFVANTDERFDVILVDSTDPVGPARALIGGEFLANARRALAPGGIMAMQSGGPLAQPREWLATVSAFKQAFSIVRPYLGWVPIYPGVVWSWVVGSDELDAASIDDVTTNLRLEPMRSRLRLYNAAAHRAAFALPAFMHQLLQQAKDDWVPSQADLRAAGHPLPGVIA